MTPSEFETRTSLFEVRAQTTRPLLALTKGKRSKRQLLETLYSGQLTLVDETKLIWNTPSTQRHSFLWKLTHFSHSFVLVNKSNAYLEKTYVT